MGYRPAKVDEQSVTEILGHMAFKAFDDFGTGLLIGSDDLTQVFGVKLLREFGGVGEIAEHHCQLTTFALGRRAR